MASKKNTFLLFLGIIAVILGIVCFCLDSGSYEPNQYYGGDAYTGIQQAAAQSANNVMQLAKICKFGFGSILIVSGGALFAASMSSQTDEYLKNIKEKLSSGKKEDDPSQEAATAVSGGTCPFCGKAIENATGFCPYCGGKL